MNRLDGADSMKLVHVPPRRPTRGAEHIAGVGPEGIGGIVTVVNVDRSWTSLRRPGIGLPFFDDPPGPFGAAIGPSARASGPAWLIDAWWLSELSRLVYRKGIGDVEAPDLGPTRAQILAGHGWAERCVLAVDGITGAVVEAGDLATIIVFRGTQALGNWISNLDARIGPGPRGGRVHAGFAAALRQMSGDLAAAIAGTPRPLLVTGHSLGGALATLAAVEFGADALWSFGAPRVGDAVFGRTLGSTCITRVVNGNDPVTAVPPPGFPWRFRHTGRPFLLHEGEVLRPRRAGSGAAARALFASLVERGQGGLTPFGEAPSALADHSPINYSRHLAWCLEGSPGA